MIVYENSEFFFGQISSDSRNHPKKRRNEETKVGLEQKDIQNLK
jgi:hypothetical protein